MTWDDGKLVHEYMGMLEQSLGDMPYLKVKEFMLDIRRHIEEGLESESSSGVVRLLDRLGSPEDLAEEFRNQMRKEEAIKTNEGTHARIPPWVVIVTVVFAFPIGLILLWFSPWWSRKAKAVATLMPVAALVLFLVLIFGGFYSYSFSRMPSVTGFDMSSLSPFPRPSTYGSPRVVVLMLMILAAFSPVISAIYLGAKLPSSRKA
jgi:uncharacterized membrane protein